MGEKHFQDEPDAEDGIPVECNVSEEPHPTRWEDCEEKLLEKGDNILITRQKEQKGWAIIFLTRKGNPRPQRLPKNYELTGFIETIEKILLAENEPINKITVRRTSHTPEKLKNLPFRFIIHQHQKDKKVTR